MDQASNSDTRSGLGDLFDKTIRRFDGLPDTVKTKASTVRSKSTIVELTQTFIIQTFRQRDEGDTICIEYIGREGSLRLALPPVVADTIARQYDALTGKNRSRAGKLRAEADKAAGILPGFKRKKA